MSAGVKTRSAARGARPQSLFYRDLGASPATRAGDGSGTPNQSAGGAALWRGDVGGGIDPPPPPFYTLDDRIERSPESTTDLSFRSPEPKFTEKNVSFNRMGHSPPSGRGSLGLAYGESQRSQGSPATPWQRPQQPHGNASSNSWFSPLREIGPDNREAAGAGDRAPAAPDGSGPLGTPGVLQQQQSGGLLTLSAPREIVRPGFLGSTIEKGAEGEEWVTVFGFGVDETNSVMREFEKCGPIVSHVSGPGGANWVHLQYQNHYDAQKALQKNGLQLNGALIVGVKRLDPLQRQALSEKANRGGLSLMALPPRTPLRGTAAVVQPAASKSLSTLVAPDGGPAPRLAVSVIASPAKSTLSKLVDLVFGV